jgi:hypothetical protein
MLLSSPRRTVCRLCLLFLKKIKIFKNSGANSKHFDFFQKNSNQSVQTVRLGELSNIVT